MTIDFDDFELSHHTNQSIFNGNVSIGVFGTKEYIGYTFFLVLK